MERIQSAIEKARKSRLQTQTETSDSTDAATVTDPQPQAPQKPQSPGPENVTELWQAIPAIPLNDKKLHRNRILAYRSCPEAAPYDMMRTKLIQQMRKNDWRRVAITSSGSGGGKTMTALNLAFSLSRQSDLRVMLIELDLRRPSIMRTLGVQRRVQFSEVLDDKASPEDHMMRYGKNVIFALNSDSARHSAELLQGVTAARVLDDLEKRYAPDIMLFDTPPLTSSDDTVAFLDQIDCALLVVEAGKNRADDVDKCEQELSARTNVLGTVLNKCRHLEASESYAYYGTS